MIILAENVFFAGLWHFKVFDGSLTVVLLVFDGSMIVQGSLTVQGVQKGAQFQNP